MAQPDEEFIGLFKGTGTAATGGPSCCASWGSRAFTQLFQVSRHHPSQAGLQSWAVPGGQLGEDEVRAPNPCEVPSEPLSTTAGLQSVRARLHSQEPGAHTNASWSLSNNFIWARIPSPLKEKPVPSKNMALTRSRSTSWPGDLSRCESVS